MGHPWVLHDWESWPDPRHVAPPFKVGGLSQDLFRFCSPPAQLTVQADQLLHTAHAPSTTRQKIFKIIQLF